MKNDTKTSGVEKKRARTIIDTGANSLKNVLVDVERDLELNQNFFLGNNVDRGKIIPKREMRKNCNSKNYSTTKVKA